MVYGNIFINIFLLFNIYYNIQKIRLSKCVKLTGSVKIRKYINNIYVNKYINKYINK